MYLRDSFHIISLFAEGARSSVEAESLGFLLDAVFVFFTGEKKTAQFHVINVKPSRYFTIGSDVKMITM